MTDRLKEQRRYTIHVPQLVGRVSTPQRDEDIGQAMHRLVGDFDTAMSELQRFLRYLQNSQDEVVVAGAYYPGTPELVDGTAGETGDPTVGWSPGDHKHQADVGIPTGLGNANAMGAGPKLAYNDHVHKRDVRVKAAGVDVGTRNALNFLDGGDGVTFTLTDDVAQDEVEVRAATDAPFWKLMSAVSLGF